jgi:hypothetical protein
MVVEHFSRPSVMLDLHHEFTILHSFTPKPMAKQRKLTPNDDAIIAQVRFSSISTIHFPFFSSLLNNSLLLLVDAL